VVVTFRGSDLLDPAERRVSRVLARTIDGAVVMTEEMRRVVGRHDALVLPYGIDTELFRPSDRDGARRSLGLDPDRPLILFPYDPGRPEKRFDLVREALDLVRRQLPAAAVLAVHSRPQAELARYMNACDALVLASDTEGSPVAVREALACGLPVVSADVGDVARVLAGLEVGGVVERNPAALAAGLLAVLCPGRRVDGTAAGHRFSMEHGAQELERLYARVNGCAHRHSHR
jgi:glycosyltransferase involved in cell wall biosynthesis